MSEICRLKRLWHLPGTFERHGPTFGRRGMSLVITSKVLSGVLIADIGGRLALFDVTLRERMHEWLEEGHRAFVLNLANVPYVDSFGLGQLITILALIRSKGGQLVLLELTDHVLALFAITKLNTVFSISVEEAHAIESVRIP
jgi:anti-sigma B factor antagonist